MPEGSLFVGCARGQAEFIQLDFPLHSIAFTERGAAWPSNRPLPPLVRTGDGRVMPLIRMPHFAEPTTPNRDACSRWRSTERMVEHYNLMSLVTGGTRE